MAPAGLVADAACARAQAEPQARDVALDERVGLAVLILPDPPSKRVLCHKASSARHQGRGETGLRSRQPAAEAILVPEQAFLEIQFPAPW